MTAMADGVERRHAYLLERLGDAAHEATGLAEFRRILLTELLTTIGADTATALPCPVALGGDDGRHGVACVGIEPRILDRYIDNRGRYRRSLQRVTDVLARSRAPIVDREIYSRRERESLDLYVEALIPAGIKATLCALASFRGRGTMLVCLNRHRVGAEFIALDLERMRTLLPVVSMIDAAIASRERSADLVDTLTTLTRREYDVASLIHAGLQNKEIATVLGTAIDTVRKQTICLYKKCGVSGRVEFIARFGNALLGGSAPASKQIPEQDLAQITIAKCETAIRSTEQPVRVASGSRSHPPRTPRVVTTAVRRRLTAR